MQLIIFRYMHDIEYVITFKSLVENTCSWWWIIQLRHYQNFPINFAIPSRIGNFRTWWRIVSKRNKIKHLERKPIWIWSDPDRLQHAIYGWLRSFDKNAWSLEVRGNPLRKSASNLCSNWTFRRIVY